MTRPVNIHQAFAYRMLRYFAEFFTQLLNPGSSLPPYSLLADKQVDQGPSKRKNRNQK